MSDMPSIMQFGQNIADVTAPDPLPKGEYKATVKSASIKDSKNKEGKQYVEVLFHIPTSEFPADFDESNAPDGANIAYRRVPYAQDRRAMFAVKRFCEALNVPMSNQIDVNDFVDRIAKVKVDWSKDLEGVDRAEIVSVSRI